MVTSEHLLRDQTHLAQVSHLKLCAVDICKLGLLLFLFLASGPPSGCTGASAISVTATDITVEWKRPNLTGRADFYYSVYYRELTNFSGITLDQYVNNNDYVDYTIDGLQPSTQYVISITVHNGVSDQDIENELSRMCEIVASTADIGGFTFNSLSVSDMTCHMDQVNQEMSVVSVKWSHGDHH